MRCVVLHLKNQFKNGPAYFPLRFFGPAKTYTKHAKVQSALVNCNIAIEKSACFSFRSTERTCNSALFSFKLKILGQSLFVAGLNDVLCSVGPATHAVAGELFSTDILWIMPSKHICHRDEWSHVRCEFFPRFGCACLHKNEERF